MSTCERLVHAESWIPRSGWASLGEAELTRARPRRRRGQTVGISATLTLATPGLPRARGTPAHVELVGRGSAMKRKAIASRRHRRLVRPGSPHIRGSSGEVYHTGHMALTPVGRCRCHRGSCRTSGHRSAQIYAHEIALDGAIPGETFTVTNNFTCSTPGVTQKRPSRSIRR